ncbi:vascular endothelial growth factor receptor 1 isoform X2 [Cephus cinctus]|uniref:receptor protein-tyrosine kinase n=1 Tax=Cephus cinctus TaxID=211228 RepID=A0AAJ7FSG9_CEPCN|nr:vascular endothelial growth factor receptor 1 isoform X2 [Cephus cinctus]
MTTRYIAFYFLLNILIAPVHLEPLSIGENESFVVQEGSALELQCRFGPDSHFSFPKLSTEFNVTTDWNISDGVFYRPRTEHGDTGWYGCAPQDVTLDPDDRQQPSTAWSYVYVKSEKNLFAVASDDVWSFTVGAGETLVIPCRPTSPDYPVKLYESGNELTLNDNRLFDPRVGFIWKNIKIKNSNFYKCTVEHNDFTLDIFCHIKVEANVKLNLPHIYNESIGHVVWGENLKANCTVNVGHGSFNLQWIPPNNSSRFHERLYVEPKSSGKTAIIEMTITDVRDEDKGTYICKVSNPYEERSTSIDIKIYDPFDTYIKLKSQGDQTYFESPAGGSISSVVYYDAYPQPTLQWIGPDNRTITSSENYEVNITNRYIKLEMKNLATKHMGNYTLVATNRNNTATLNITVVVTSKPVTLMEPILPYYKPSSLTSINCHAASYPKANISWQYIHCPETYPCDEELQITEDLTNSTLKPVEDRTAVISTVTLMVNTTGRIVCIASNPRGVVNSTEVLFVSDGEGIFGLDRPKSNIVEGDDFELTCTSSVYNYTDKLEWYDQNKQPIEETERLKIVTSNTMFTHRSTLSIRNVSKNDMNIFICAGVPNDSERPNYQYYNLTVFDSKEPFFEETNMNETEITFDLNANKRNVYLLCNIGGMPVPTVTWYKNDEIIKENDQFKFYNEHELYIKFLLERDEGKYTCRGTNRIGEIETFQRILIKKKPTSPILIVSVVVLIIICFILMTVFFIKFRREKIMRKELIEAGLMHFEEGAMECLNPDLTVDDQAELLPYDKKWEFPRERLKLGKQLGSGAFGVVMKAEAQGISEDESVTTVAVKMVRRGTDPTYIRALASELKIMVHLGKHLNVVNLLGACTKNIAKRELFVIVEYCRFGNLHNYLLRHRADFINQIDPTTGKIDPSIGQEFLTRSTSICSSNRLKYAALTFSRSLSATSGGSGGEPMDYREGTDSQGVSMSPDGCIMSNNSSQPGWRSNYRGDYKDQNLKPICTQDLLSWAYQVAGGMEYLSCRKVLHGDLAARNILLAENNVVKICDFGLAKSMYKDDNYKKKGDSPLPIKWMAIESIRDRIFSTQSDIWSFGIVLWEFFTLAETPYPGMEAEKQYQKLIEGYRMEQPEYATKEVYEIMTQCWKAKPTLRPTFPKLVESIGNLLEESVKTRYLELNVPYMDMNTITFETGKSDYLTMMSAPDHTALSSTVPDYVNSPITLTSNNSYLLMSPTNVTEDSGIFSPRPDVTKSHFAFPSVDQTADLPEDLEMTPMLPENSDYLKPIDVQQRRAEFAKQRQNQSRQDKPQSDYTNAPLVSVDKNSDNLNRSLEKDLTDLKNFGTPIIRTQDNYVNMPKQKSDLRKDPVNSFSNPSYVIINDKDQTRI